MALSTRRERITLFETRPVHVLLADPYSTAPTISLNHNLSMMVFFQCFAVPFAMGSATYNGFTIVTHLYTICGGKDYKVVRFQIVY